MMRILKPTNPSRRHTVLSNRCLLWKKKPIRSLISFNSLAFNRNNLKKITIKHRVNGSKKLYRLIDSKRLFKFGFTFIRLEYDPNRSGYISLVRKMDKLSYILSPEGIESLAKSNKRMLKVGNSLELHSMPFNTPIYNVETKKSKGGQISRSAGNSSLIIGKNENKVFLRLCSGEIRTIYKYCLATIGIVSNQQNKNTSYGKAGRSFWNGMKSNVRGVAKNPVDHPHGGGEGKSGCGRQSTNKNGIFTKGFRTVKRYSSSIVRKRYF